MQSIVLITGATAGIGAATARALIATHHVVLVGRRRERLSALVSELGARATFIAEDLTAEGAPVRIVAEIERRGCRIAGLVNNAGSFEVARSEAITADHAERQWRLHVLAPMLLTGAALPQLCNGGGTIVNLSSIAAEVAFPGCGVYAGTKAALEAWSRSLREELRGSGVRVSVVVPGATDTDIWPVEAAVDRTRMCQVEDVAAMIRLALTLPTTASLDRLVITPPSGPV